jgi:hydroxypyruvate isomerase
MNRRKFAQTMAASALAAVGAGRAAVAEPSPAGSVPLGKGPEFGLSVMLWTVFKDLPFEERLAKVAEAGYRNVELVGEYAKWTNADWERALGAQKRLGIKFDATAGLGHGIADPVVREAFLNELRAALGPMERLDCPAMIVLSGDTVPGLSREAQHASCVEGLKQAAKLVEGKQIDGQPVRLLLECIHVEERPKYFLTSAAEAIEVIRAVNHPEVQFLYDIFHEQMGFGNLIEKLEKNIDVIGLIHIADVPGRHEPGSGEIYYTNIYRKLAELKYRKVVAMEFLPLGDPVEALRLAREMVGRDVQAVGAGARG